MEIGSSGGMLRAWGRGDVEVWGALQAYRCGDKEVWRSGARRHAVGPGTWTCRGALEVCCIRVDVEA